MCGIAGIVDLQGCGVSPSRGALARMAAALHHRGPDEHGIYRDPAAGLAHARLSIIDLAGGHQPLCNEDETLWIVFNGEIFNYLDLREELVTLGHRFRTRSDTEVIVHAYEAWGDAAFQRMNGQWALALWDSTRRRLVLSRDRMGVRPLYLCEHRGRLHFASEVKAIFAADAAIPRAFDPAGLDQTFTFWSVVPPQSVFGGIEELRPGYVRVYENGRMREAPYWEPRFPTGADGLFAGSLDEAVDAVRKALEEATSLRMLRADVPVGSYLSGGLDSSLVAALGRAVAGDNFQTFSLRFADVEYDETPFQRLMVERLGSVHHEIVVGGRDIAQVFPEVIYHTERPVLRTAPAPLFLLSRLVAQAGIKVVLTGEGADEVFAGYDLFREAKVRRFWARQPQSESRPRLLERLYPYLARSPVAQQAMTRRFFGRGLADFRSAGFAHAPRWQTTSAIKRLFTPQLHDALAGTDATAQFLDSLPERFARWTPLAQDQYIETRTLLAGYILASQGDRMLMAHSVEGRFPFLDKEVVALADSLPAAYKLRALDEKHVVKKAARALVPAQILARPKQPYRAPDALSFVGPDVPEYVPELLGETAVAAAGVFNPTAVTRLLAKCTAAAASGTPLSNTDNMALVGVLSTQLVHYQYIAGRPRAGGTIKFRTDVDRTESGKAA